MLCISDVTGLAGHTSDWRSRKEKIALVPTMGNLHEGHLSLVRKAADIADRVIVSIFVNPAQFVTGEDFESYPRTPESDHEKLEKENVDLVFSPPVDALYHDEDPYSTRVTVTGLDNIYCGKTRPGHFAGVATVVTKLLNVTNPDIAIFGEKDYQQLLVIRYLVRDLCIPVEIVSMPTMREPDGLALSSRNMYLDKSERQIAPVLYQVLQQTADAISRGNTDFAQLSSMAVRDLDAAGFRTDYVAICDAGTLGPPGEGDLVILAAASIGRARLIDNVVVRC